MCNCLEVSGAPLWGSRCKCTHVKVRMMGERIIKGAMVRTWICDMPECYRSWDINMGFASQDQLEGRV